MSNTITNATACFPVVTTDDNFINYATFPMVALTFAMSFVIQRKHRYPECCSGRPGILVPINFVRERRGRPALAAGFVILTSRLIALAFGEPYWMQQYYFDPEFNEDFNYVFVLVKSVNVVQLSMCFYPLLACIHHHRYIVFNLLGILLLTPWVYFTSIGYVNCVNEFKTMSMAAVFRVLIDLPELISYLIVTVFCLKMCYRNWRVRRREGTLSACYMCANDHTQAARSHEKIIMDSNHTYGSFKHSFKRSDSIYPECSLWCCCAKDDLLLPEEHRPQDHELSLEPYETTKSHIAYVQALLRRKPSIKETGTVATLKEEFTYRRVAGLRTSPRIIVTLASAIVGIYAVGWQAIYLLFVIQDLLEQALQYVIDEEFFPPQPETVHKVQQLINLIVYGSLLCNILAVIFQSIALWRVLVNYRKDTRTLLRGDRRKFDFADLSTEYLLLCNTYYSGYQIIFAFYAYVVTFALLFLVIVIVIGGLLYLPLAWGLNSPVVKLLRQYWATVVISILIYVVQYYLVKCLFITKDNTAIYTNRRLYHVMDYFMFFFNTLLSIFTSLKSILLSLLYGIVFMARLDQCRMVHGYEGYDSGHNAYLGVLYIQRMLNNPIVLAFTEILSDEARDNVLDEYGHRKPFNELRLRQHRARLRWYKLVTLINNPGLVVENLTKRVADDVQRLTKSATNTNLNIVS